jgi:hypothetical protein
VSDPTAETKAEEASRQAIEDAAYDYATDQDTVYTDRGDFFTLDQLQDAWIAGRAAGLVVVTPEATAEEAKAWDEGVRAGTYWETNRRNTEMWLDTHSLKNPYLAAPASPSMEAETNEGRKDN